jgi:Tfp pilus assembly protein PilE
VTALISVKIFVGTLLIAAVPAYAQAQSRSTAKATKGDAQKVATIIRSDKAKTQTYCEINKVSDQMNLAYGKNDKKTLDELS